jgi:hypothetical protein
LKNVVVCVVACLAACLILAAVAIAVLDDAPPPVAVAPDASAMRDEIATLRGDIAELSTEIRSLIDAQRILARNLAMASRGDASGVEGAATAAGVALDTVPDPSLLTEHVAAVIAEERRLEAEERQRRDEERRQLFEQARQEREALRQGPYDRYNAKINSLASVVGMNDAQKQSYFELLTAQREKLDAGMAALRAARSTSGEANAQGEEGQRRGRRGGGVDREAAQALSETLQTEFAAGMQQILSAEQYTTWDGLSRAAKSFGSADVVTAAGESERGGRFGAIGGQATGGGGRGGFGGGGGRGGR